MQKKKLEDNFEVKFTRRLSTLSGTKAISIPRNKWGSVDYNTDFVISITKF